VLEIGDRACVENEVMLNAQKKGEGAKQQKGEG
jgi:hypothetical protein